MENHLFGRIGYVAHAETLMIWLWKVAFVIIVSQIPRDTSLAGSSRYGYFHKVGCTLLAEIFAKSIRITIQKPLDGLEGVEACQIRPLEPTMLFAVANRFLKLHFPPSHDYELYTQVICKALLSPQLSKGHLQTLPLVTLERLFQRILQTTVQELGAGGSDKEKTFDWILTLINSMEESCQYNLSALVSEDLALLESHQKGGLHGYFFKPSRNREQLAQLLQSQGYWDGLMQVSITDTEPLEPHFAYWLCRRLTLPLPWSAILELFKRERPERFPYLHRLSGIKSYLSEVLDLSLPEQPTEELVNELLPRIRDWIGEVFPEFSQRANVPRPIQAIVLVEGSTEELLIPASARALGYNLDREGIFIQPVGGKNQMLQQYINYIEHLAVPISIVLDRDAHSMRPDLAYYQRPQDQILILEEGELEDIYALDPIVKTINKYYQPHPLLTLAGFRKMEGSEGRVKTLQALWHDLGLGLFDKIEFAQYLAQSLRSGKQVSSPMKYLIQKLVEAKQHVKPTLSD